jgi:hypothetical protein
VVVKATVQLHDIKRDSDSDTSGATSENNI